MQRLLYQLDEHARRRPNVTAFFDGTQCHTWDDYRRSIHAIGARAATRLPESTSVILSAQNSFGFACALIGLMAVGKSVLVTHPDSTDTELASLAGQIDADTAVVDDTSRAAAENSGLTIWPIENAIAEGTEGPTPNGDGSLLLQSSSTTGPPKLVRRGDAALEVVACNVAKSVGLRPSDRVLAVVPMTHSYGIECNVLGPLWAGAGVVVMQGFDHAVLTEAKARTNATVLPGVPAMYEMLARIEAARRPMLGLRRAFSAGAPMPEAIHRELAGAGLSVGQLYGSTETGAVTFEAGNAPGFDPTGAGFPMPGVQIRILDADDLDIEDPLPTGTDGHIAVLSPSGFSCYENDPELTERSRLNGYFLTGDLGHVDPYGRLHVTGRLKLMIDVGAVKVNPAEVEHVLRSAPGVQDCIVVPINISQTVRRVKALIEPIPDHAPSVDSLRRHARLHLSPHKVPRVFEFRDSFPRSPTGKILRSRL